MEENLGTHGLQEAALNEKVVFQLEVQNIDEIDQGLRTDENPPRDN